MEEVREERKPAASSLLLRFLCLLANPLPPRLPPLDQKGPAACPEAERVEVDRYSTLGSRRREGKPIEQREGRLGRSNGSWSRYCMALPGELSAENIAILVSKSRAACPARISLPSSLSLFSVFLLPRFLLSLLSSGPGFSSFPFLFRSREERKRLERAGERFKGWLRGSRQFGRKLVASSLRISGRIWCIGMRAVLIPRLFSCCFFSSLFSFSRTVGFRCGILLQLVKCGITEKLGKTSLRCESFYVPVFQRYCIRK